MRFDFGRAVGACVIALALTACDAGGGGADGAPGPELQAPSTAPDLTARRFNGAAEAAALTGWLDLTETYQLGVAGDAADAEAAAGQTILAVRAEKGQQLEASLEDTVDPAAQIGGAALRTLMDLPLDAVPALYRVTNEAGDGAKLCGEQATTHLVTWEDAAQPQGRLVLLAVTGGAPGASGATLCQVLTYQRSGA